MFFINSNSVYQIPSKLTSLLNPRLESTDAAPEVSYPHPTRDAASDAVARVLHRVGVFFFSRICADSARSHRCGSIRAESASIRAESASIRAEPG